jgi:hypothetical protein
VAQTRGNCVNKELEMGKPIGRFTPTNQCLSFVKRMDELQRKYNFDLDKGPDNRPFVF